MKVEVKKKLNRIKSPLNYIGGKYKLLEQILPLFPTEINNFIDLFAGGCNVGINTNAEKVYFNDNLIYLIEMYKLFQQNECIDTFEDFDFSFLTSADFVYCDPPYLITTGTYNDGKRGFKGSTEKEEKLLLQKLDELNQKNIKFALSNVLEHKGKSNEILKNWITTNSNYKINYIDFNYSNSNYQTIIRDKNASIEVLITNYEPEIQEKLSLF